MNDEKNREDWLKFCSDTKIPYRQTMKPESPVPEKVMECPELEGAYKDRVQLLGLHKTAPKTLRIHRILCVRALPKCFLSLNPALSGIHSPKPQNKEQKEAN